MEKRTTKTNRPCSSSLTVAREKRTFIRRKPPKNRRFDSCLTTPKGVADGLYCGFRVYEPLNEDDAFDRQYVVHGEGEYAAGDVHINTCESHTSLARQWLSPHRDVSKDKLTPYLRALQLRKRVRRKPGDEALKTILETAL